MQKTEFQRLIGKNKEEVIEILGDQMNYYPSNVWSYLLGYDFLGRRKYLVIYFFDSNISSIKITKCYGKLRLAEV